MNKFVSYDKMSKRQKKEINAKKRESWAGFRPHVEKTKKGKIMAFTAKHKNLNEENNFSL